MAQQTGQRIEWRSRSEGDDVLIAVDEDSNEVLRAWAADPALLTDFLNDMTELASQSSGSDDQPTQQNWGDLVVSRSAEGDVLDIDPQLYWEGVAYWFRSRGADPHPWHRRT